MTLSSLRMLSFSPRSARGFGVIAALMVLVMMAALSAAIVRVGMSQQVASTQSMQAEKATYLATAGVDFGLYYIFKGAWGTCAGQTYSATANGTAGGARLFVTCDSVLYNEGETAPGVPRTVRVYTITSTACAAAASCPDNTAATKRGYVERVRQAVVVN